MKKFVVMKKCVATEPILVEAADEQEALRRVKYGQGRGMLATLQFEGYLPNSLWTVEDIKEQKQQDTEDSDDGTGSNLLCD